MKPEIGSFAFASLVLPARHVHSVMYVFSPIRLAYGVLTYFVKARCLSRKVARDALNRDSDAFSL